MSLPAKLEERFRVRSYEVEPDGRLRMVTLARMLQEMAWHHAKMLGKGLVDRGSGGLFWVLSRIRMQIDRYPRWEEEFTLRTWPVGTDKLLAIREFAMLDSEGTMGRMTTGWLVIDGDSGRPLRPEPVVRDWPRAPSGFEGSIAKLPPVDNVEPGPVHVVEHHDIDQYRHANNSAYVEWIVDEIAAHRRRAETATEFSLPSIAALSLDFMKELLEGEQYRICVSDGDAQTGCEIVREEDGEAVCRAAIEWQTP